MGKLPKYFTIFALLPPIHTGCSPHPGVAVSNGLPMGKKMQRLCKGRQFPAGGFFPAQRPHGPCPGVSCRRASEPLSSL